VGLIPAEGTFVLVVCFVCSGLCDEMIFRPEDSCSVCLCVCGVCVCGVCVVGVCVCVCGGGCVCVCGVCVCGVGVGVCVCVVCVCGVCVCGVGVGVVW